MSTKDKEYLWRSIESEDSGSECHSQAQEEEIVKTREPDDSEEEREEGQEWFPLPQSTEAEREESSG